jgi:hypothetical protein
LGFYRRWHSGSTPISFCAAPKRLDSRGKTALRPTTPLARIHNAKTPRAATPGGRLMPIAVSHDLRDYRTASGEAIAAPCRDSEIGDKTLM